MPPGPVPPRGPYGDAATPRSWIWVPGPSSVQPSYGWTTSPFSLSAGMVSVAVTGRPSPGVGPSGGVVVTGAGGVGGGRGAGVVLGGAGGGFVAGGGTVVTAGAHAVRTPGPTAATAGAVHRYISRR